MKRKVAMNLPAKFGRCTNGQPRVMDNGLKRENKNTAIKIE